MFLIFTIFIILWNSFLLIHPYREICVSKVIFYCGLIYNSLGLILFHRSFYVSFLFYILSAETISL